MLGECVQGRLGHAIGGRPVLQAIGELACAKEALVHAMARTVVQGALLPLLRTHIPAERRLHDDESATHSSRLADEGFPLVIQ